MKRIIRISLVLIVLFSMIISGRLGVKGIAPQYSIAQDRACYTVDLPAIADTYINDSDSST